MTKKGQVKEWKEMENNERKRIGKYKRGKGKSERKGKGNYEKMKGMN